MRKDRHTDDEKTGITKLIGGLAIYAKARKNVAVMV